MSFYTSLIALSHDPFFAVRPGDLGQLSHGLLEVGPVAVAEPAEEPVWHPGVLLAGSEQQILNLASQGQKVGLGAVTRVGGEPEFVANYGEGSLPLLGDVALSAVGMKRQ
jgi:hypothetical protein